MAQGILNNGASIVMTGSSQMYLYGGSNGSYLSQSGGKINPATMGPLISLEGNWTNNSANTGFSNDAGTVALTGTAQNIGGTNSTTFYNLNLQGSGTKTQNINTVVGGVTIKAGVFSVGAVVYDLNTYTLNISNPATTAVTYGTGYVLSEINAANNTSVLKWSIGTSNGPHIYPFGVSGSQIPLTFNVTSPMASASDFVSISTRATSNASNTPWAGPSSVGAVTHMFNPTIGADGSVEAVVDRWWDINSSGAVTADVTFAYRGVENTLIPPYNTGNIGAQHWNGAGWDPIVGSAPIVSAGVGSVTASGLNTFSPWVLSSVMAVLPIELLSFNGNCVNNDVILSWSTATEKNSSYFTIEKSNDGKNFYQLAMLKCGGNSYKTLNYSFLDKEGGFMPTSYYRLKQTDVNGVIHELPTIVVSNCEFKKEEIKICSNFNGKSFVCFTMEEAAEMEMGLFDVLGRQVWQNNVHVERGFSVNEINASELQEAYYLLRVKNKDEIRSGKVYIKN